MKKQFPASIVVLFLGALFTFCPFSIARAEEITPKSNFFSNIVFPHVPEVPKLPSLLPYLLQIKEMVIQPAAQTGKVFAGIADDFSRDIVIPLNNFQKQSIITASIPLRRIKEGAVNSTNFVASKIDHAIGSVQNVGMSLTDRASTTANQAAVSTTNTFQNFFGNLVDTTVSFFSSFFPSSSSNSDSQSYDQVVVPSAPKSSVATSTKVVNNQPVVERVVVAGTNTSLILRTISALTSRIDALEGRPQTVINNTYVAQQTDSIADSISRLITSNNTNITNVITNSIPSVDQSAISITGGTITGVNATTTDLEVAGTLSFDGLYGSSGQVLVSQGTSTTPVWQSLASAATNTDQLSEGLSNLYFSDARARNALSLTATGLDFATSTGIFSLTSGYNIPLIASTTSWNDFYTTPSNRISAGTGLLWTGNSLSNTGVLSIGGLTGAVSTSSLGITSSQWTASSSDIYYSTGNVGIGTDTPSESLHVVGGVRISTLGLVGVVHSDIDGILSSSLVDLGTEVIGNIDLTHFNAASNATPLTFWRGDGVWETPDHGSMAGLSDDDHAQYLLLAGRSGGQSIMGGTASGDDLILRSTSNATKGSIFFGNNGTVVYDEVNDRFGIGTTTPGTKLDVYGTAGTADIFAISSSTNSRLFTVTSSGNVGIGTTSPVGKFEVIGGDVGIGVAGTSLGGSVRSLRIGGLTNATVSLVGAKDWQFSSVSDGTFSFYNSTDSVTAMRVLATGQVGINIGGSASPLTYLHVNDYSSGISAPLTVSNNNTGVGVGSSQNYSAYTTGTTYGTFAQTGFVTTATGAGTHSGDYYISTANSGTVAERLRVTAAGNVGIGTTTPGSALTVVGTSNITGASIFGGAATFNGVAAFRKSALPTSISSANHYLQIGGLEESLNGYALIGFGYAGGTQQPGYFGFQETTLASQEKGDFVWGLRDVVTDTLPTERMRLTSAGNLGLGTTTPGSKLVVNGNIDIGTTTTSAAGQITQNGTRLLHTYGTSNLFMGANAGNFTTTGTLNSSYGAGTLQYLTSASENNAFGYSALANTTSGSSNMAMGSSALYSNTTGTRNTAIGRAAMYYNTDSGDNVAIGYNVLFNTGGFGANTVIGTSAMFNATGNLLENTVIGYNSLLNANGARYNTVIGSSGGNAVTSGFYNTIIGRGSGSNITTGSSNIIIGDRVDAPSATASNQLNIGNIIFGTSIDGTGTTISTGNVGIGTTTPAARFQVTGAGGTNPFRVASSTNVSMLEITQAGNVGIGTTAPGAKLQIGESTGTVPTNTNLFIEGGKSLRFGSNNGNADYGTYMRSDYLANAALVFGTRELGVDTDTFTLTNGRLGIGTTNPTTPLEISNPGANYDTLRLSNTASGGYRRQGIILQHGNDSEESVVTLQAYTAADNSDNTLFWGGGSSLYNTVTTQRFYTAANGNTLTGSERMRITGDGNIGIGTTTPSHNLTIAGNINFTGSLYQNGTAFSSAGNSAFTFGNGFIYNATSTDLVGIGSSTPISTLSVKGKGGVNPFTISSSTNAILFNVTQAGNVGIGTSTPGSLLTLGSGQFSVPKGTSTLPSITFGGETSSGFYGITGQANSVAYSYAGVEAFRFDGNGLGVPKPSTNRRYITTFDSVSGSTAWSVGSNATEDYFGFTNPNNDGSGFFHSGSTGNVEYRYQAYSLANLGIVFRDDANTFYVRANSGTQSGNLQEWRNSSDVALSVVGPTGNFGIGTTTPSARLAVTGIAGTGDIFAIASSTEARLLTVTSAGNVGIGTTTPGFLLTLATTASAPLQLRSTNTRTFIRFDNNTATTRYLGLNSSGNMVFYGSDSVTENMVVTNAGNVAIGTTTPATKLNVWGTGEAARFGDNTNTSTYLGFAYNSVSGSPRGFFGHDSGRGNTVVQAGSTKGIEFNVNNDTFGSGYVMSIKSTGDIGIGTTTPVAKLAITGTTGSSTDLFTVASSTNSRLFTITAAGRVGIGTTTPGAQLTTTGTVQFSGLGGAGAVTSDAVGNLTTASDERLKDIEGDFTRGLEDIKKINPISYHWKTETGYDTSNLYSGFSAQNVQLAIPEAVLPNSQGYLSLQERPILAAAINAIKELASVFSKIEDGIAYVKTIVVERFTIGSSEKPAGITIYDQATGAPYCIQVVNGTMVNVSGACGITSSAPSSSSTDTTTGGGDQLVIDNSDTSLVASSTPTEDIPVETDVISEEDNTPETPSAESAPVPEPAETLEPAPEQVSAPIADSTPSNPPADTGSTI